ncbi:hypothetical protein [Campylobacter sp.]|nr:hypothetical protein [Campylobacter sp.]
MSGYILGANDWNFIKPAVVQRLAVNLKSLNLKASCDFGRDKQA